MLSDLRIWVDGEDLSRYVKDLELSSEHVAAFAGVEIRETLYAEIPRLRLPFEEGDVLRVQSGDIHRDFRVEAVDHDEQSFVLVSCDGGPWAELVVPGNVISIVSPDGIERKLEISE